MAAAVQYSVAGVLIGYYTAKLVRAEKEHSDWLPEWSKFSYNGPLRWTACFKTYI